MLTEEQRVISQIWNSKSIIETPPNIRKCNIDLLIGELVKAATLTRKYEHKFVDYAYFLVLSDTISWAHLLKTLRIFKNFTNYSSTIGLCKFISDILPQVSIQSFADSSEIQVLLDAIADTFLWIIDIIKKLMKEPVDWSYEGDDPLEQPLSTCIKFLEDKFCGRVLSIALRPDMLKNVLLIEEMMVEKNDFSPVAMALAGKLSKTFKGIFKSKVYVENNCSLTLYKIRNPSIRILTSIFVCYRVLMTVEEIADAYYAFFEIMDISFEDIVFDMIHGTLLIKAEENVDLPFLPKERRVDFQWHVALFFYMKMTQIWKLMIKKYHLSPENVEKAIKRVNKELKMTLDIVDVIWKDCSIKRILDNLVEDQVIDKEIAENIIEERLTQMKDVPELNKLVIEMTKPENERTPNDHSVLMSSSATATAMLTKSEKVLLLLPSMVEIGTGAPFDAIIGAMCVYGKLTEYSHSLAILNTKSQTDGEDMADRIQTFDFSFLLLSRISVKWPSVPLKMLVNNGPISTIAEKEGIFFKWADHFLKRVKRKKKEEENVEKEEKEKEEDKKEEKEEGGGEEKEKEEEKPKTDNMFGVEMISKEVAQQHLQKLKEREPFWDDKDASLNIPSLIYTIPVIGEVLLEEYGNKRMDRENLTESILNILHSLQELSCLFVCLVQWLDCQPDSAARRSLATSIHQALEKSSIETKKWAYCLSMLKQIIQEMSEKTPAYPEVTCTAFSTARRYCPKITRSEHPDMVKLKSAWYYMQLQGWASPHALRLLEHSNCAGEYNAWSHVYVNKTIQIGCGDLMKKCVDMIFSFLMLDKFNCIIRMHESLMEFWFAEEGEQLNDGRFEPASIMPIIRLMTNIMMLTAWELHYLKKKVEEGPSPPKKINLDEPIETPDIDDPDSPQKWIYLLESLLEVTINKFMKKIQKGLMSPVVCAICHLIKSIASSPASLAKDMLIRKIPPKLIYGISYIDPSALSYELLEVFCDADNQEHTLERLKYLCALRRKNFI